MPNQEAVGDLAYTVSALLDYLREKGQVHSASQLASILLINEHIKRKYRVDLHLDRFVETWVELSPHEMSRWETVAQKNVEKIANINAQVNNVVEQGTRTKILPFFGRRDGK